MINNARRRCEEHKYDDAIARLYRSLELVGQIRLREYGLDSSNIDLDILKEKNVDEDFINKLDLIRNDDGKIKVGLEKDFEILSKIDEDFTEFYTENKNKIRNILKLRNNSILAHGMEAKTYEDYKKFKEIVLKSAKLLTDNIDEYIEDTKFPEFNSDNLKN